MVKLLCGRRGNHEMYIVNVTPYILGVDGAKNFLVGACELFYNQQFLTNYDWNLYNNNNNSLFTFSIHGYTIHAEIQYRNVDI